MNKRNEYEQPMIEITEGREANVRVFEAADHSRVAAVYQTPVHYMKDGQWQPIDATLTEGTEEAGDAENCAGSLKIRLANKAKEKKMIRIGDGHERLAWGLCGCSSVKREPYVVNADGQPESGAVMQMKADTDGSDAAKADADDQSIFNVGKLQSAVIYPKLLPDTDLIVRIQDGRVKEDIVLCTPEAPHSFTWQYDTGKLTATQEKPESPVCFAAEDGTVLYELSAPFMQDAMGSQSTDVSLVLDDTDGKKTVRVTCTVDEAWLTATERVYPVIIDPVIQTSMVRSDIQDAHISSYYKNTNYMNMSILKAGCTDDGTVLRSYLKLPLPSITESAENIRAAQFYLVKWPGGSDRRQIDVHRVTGSWSSSSLTWNNHPEHDDRILDYAVSTSAEQQNMTFDVTRTVKEWYRSGVNNGFLIKEHDEQPGTYTQFVSSDDGTYPTLRPSMLISYVNHTGLEDYWTYHSQDAGRAGTGHINDHNGNLVFVHDTLSMSGNRMPVSLAHVYNASKHADNSYDAGKGWRLSYDRKVSEVKVGEKTYQRYTDGDATAHYFAKDKEGVWKDEDGLELTMTVTDTSKTITDKDHGKLIFNADGYLTKVQDADGNALTVTWSGDHITKLLDGSGRQTTLAYDGTTGLLSSVTDPAGRKKTFTYSDTTCLTAITDSDGTVCRFTYDGGHLMKTVSDPYGYQLRYSYGSTSPQRVSGVAEYADGVAGHSLSFVYMHDRTKITDEKGRYQYMLFNEAGNTISMRDDKGNRAAWHYGTGAETKKTNWLLETSGLQHTPVQLIRGIIGDLDFWQTSGSGTTITEVSSSDAGPFAGSHAFKISSGATSLEGAIRQDSTLINGKTYVFSAYVKTEVTEAAADGGIYLLARQPVGDSWQTLGRSRVIREKTSGWERIEVMFTVPETGSTSIRVMAWLHSIKGSASFSGMQLEEAAAAGHLNFVTNNSFRHNLSGYTVSGDTDPEDGVVSAGSTIAGTSLKMTVTADTQAVRSGADTTFSQIATLKKGQVLNVHGGDYDKYGVKWYCVGISTASGIVRGYVRGESVKLSGSAALIDVTGIAGINYLAVRTGAGSNNDVKVYISRGQIVTVIGAAKDADGLKWYHVAFEKSGKTHEGYVSSVRIGIFYPASETGVITGSGTSNVRYGPGTDSDINLTLDPGDSFTVTARTVLKDDLPWYYVSGTKSGKAYKGYVKENRIKITARKAMPPIALSAPEPVPEGCAPIGTRVYMMKGGADKDKRLSYRVGLSGKKNDSYVAGGWGCGYSVPDAAGRHFGLRVNFKYVSADGKTEKDDIHYKEFCADTTGWQYLSEAFVAKQDYTEIYVGFCYHQNANTAWFTGLSLFKELFGTSYAYDDKGNVISVKDKAGKASTFTYNGANDLTKMTDPQGRSFTYTYDSKHNVTGAVSAAGLKYAFTYDSFGNPKTSAMVDPANAAKKIISSAGYSNAAPGVGQYQTSVTDPAGRTSSSSWDVRKGLAASAEKPDGSTTAYTYDSGDRLTAVAGSAQIGGTQGQTKAQYTYADGRLAAVRHHGFDYGFAYDGFGRVTEVKVAGQYLMGHTYREKNGQLEGSTYGNNNHIQYSYDDLDRVESIATVQKYGNVSMGGSTEQPVKQWSYRYDAQGRLARVIDELHPEHSCSYSYDLLGRLAMTAFDDGTSYRYEHDVNDCLVKEIHEAGGSTRTLTRTYDADGREKKSACGKISAEKTYDALGRLTTVKRGGHTTTYSYLKNTAGNETTDLASVTTAAGSGTAGKTVSYTYDLNGNVSSVTKDGQKTSYVYDSQGQLIRENDQAANETHVYLYDAGGNLTEKRTYAYTTAETGTLGTAAATETFTYDSSWKDLLATANGQAITHDGAGNRLTDGTCTYTWRNGRQLATVTKSGMMASYQYGADGIRLSKTVDGVTTRFLTAGNHVLAEQKGSGSWQHYFYDASGQLTAITYKGADYYYVRDGLMNITGLVDSNGATVVEYSYDSWGRIKAVSGNMKDTLGADNPYRYKGYYYDVETGLYYLGSRYYDVETYRFISLDAMQVVLASPMKLRDKNLFAYCDNNPVIRMDVNGMSWQLALIGALASVGAAIVASAITGDELTLQDILCAAAIGAVPGGIGGRTGLVLGTGISGMYTMQTSLDDGADFGTAVLNGFISGGAAVISVGGVSTMVGAKFTNGVSAIMSTVFDAPLGAAANIMTSSLTATSVQESTHKNSRFSPVAYAISMCLAVALKMAINEYENYLYHQRVAEMRKRINERHSKR